MNTQTNFTRHDYMNKKCSHFEYYSQFVNEVMKSVILRKYSKEQLTKLFEEDKHLNNIPLKFWDSSEGSFKQDIARTNKRLSGESIWSLSDHVCAMKAAAQKIINS